MPPGWQPAGWPVYPAPKRRRRWLPWVIVASVLAVGGCGALIGTVGVKLYRQMDDAKNAVDDYLLAIEHDDLAAAQALVCDELRPDEPQRTAEAGLVAHRVIGAASVHSNFGSDEGNRTSATVTVNVTLAGGVRHRDIVDVEYEHDRWLFCGVVHSKVLD